MRVGGCNHFTENQCQGQIIVTDPSFDDHRWFTPSKSDPHYLPSFQDYSRLVGHAHVEYSASGTVTVQILCTHKANATLTYSFDGKAQVSNTKTFPAAAPGITKPVSVSVTASDGAKLELEPVDLLHSAPKVLPVNEQHFRAGQKGAIVEMFGWPHKDVEAECPKLGALGYLGVKVYPTQEQVMSTQPFQKVINPWYFMYQPVSYRLSGRMGSRDELRSMIHACRKAGVRVYADAVINHMSGGGNDANYAHRNGNGGSCTTWGAKTTSMAMHNSADTRTITSRGAGANTTGGSPYYTQNYAYECSKTTGRPPSQEFPAVPFGPVDFHCERVLNSWTDPLDLNAGWLTGLTDLNTERPNVQKRIADYLTDLLAIGFSGFRIDAAKHIQPDDLVAIFTQLRANLGGALPADFITWWEVLLGGEADLLMCNAASGYNYGAYLESALAKAGFSTEDIRKVKIWNSGYPKEPEKGMVNCTADNDGTHRNVIQNDDADQQNPGSSSRDMGDDGCVLIKGCAEAEHRQYEVKLFTSPNGATNNDDDYPIRVVLSSYFWQNGSTGVPDGLSDCSLCVPTHAGECDGCQTVAQTPAFDAASTGYDKGVYTRVHRDAAIVAAMRKWIGLD
eukprot:g1583.t1